MNRIEEGKRDLLKLREVLRRARASAKKRDAKTGYSVERAEAEIRSRYEDVGGALLVDLDYFLLSPKKAR